MKDIIYYLKRLYVNEKLHHAVYAALAKSEKNPKLKALLEKLVVIEASHQAQYGRILKINDVGIPTDSVGAQVGLIAFLRRFIGLALSVKIIEYFEMQLESSFDRVLGRERLNARSAALLKAVWYDEEKHERALEDAIVGYGRIIKNIRDVAFGMNDGLVEILGVVVGLAAAINNPVLILLGGVIVAVSGTLSMGGGAYLSTEYEITIHANRKGGIKERSALGSGLYVGVMYLVGSLFPLAPFIFGMVGPLAIALSVVITALVLTVISTMIAIISDTPIYTRVSRTLLISLGISAITIAIGLYARMALHLPV